MRNKLIMYHIGLQSMFTRFGSACAQTTALHIQLVAYSLASTKGRTSMIYSATLPRAWRLLADLGARLEAHTYSASAGAALRRPARSSQRDVNTAVRSGEHTCGLSTVRPLRQPGNKRRQPLSGPALAPSTMHQSLLSALLQVGSNARAR